MKLNKEDLHNLGCLKLAEMGVWTDEECLNSMKWGNRYRNRTQKRYLKKLVEKLADINMKEPGLIEELFEYKGDEKLAELCDKHNINEPEVLLDPEPQDEDIADLNLAIKPKVKISFNREEFNE